MCLHAPCSAPLRLSSRESCENTWGWGSGWGSAQLIVVPGSPLPVVPFAFCSPWGNPPALGSLQHGLPHRQQPAPAPVAVLGRILLPGPHIPTKRCPAGRAAPPSSRWSDPRGVLPQGLRTQPLHPGCSQPCATVTAHLQWKFPLGLPLFGPSSPLAPARQPSVQQVKLCRCSRLPTAAPCAWAPRTPGFQQHLPGTNPPAQRTDTKLSGARGERLLPSVPIAAPWAGRMRRGLRRCPWLHWRWDVLAMPRWHRGQFAAPGAVAGARTFRSGFIHYLGA